MNIDRTSKDFGKFKGEVNQSLLEIESQVALQRLKFTLDEFEKLKFNYEERDWLFRQDVIPNCNVEEILGALVISEQMIKAFIEGKFQIFVSDVD